MLFVGDGEIVAPFRPLRLPLARGGRKEGGGEDGEDFSDARGPHALTFRGKRLALTTSRYQWKLSLKMRAWLI